MKTHSRPVLPRPLLAAAWLFAVPAVSLHAGTYGWNTTAGSWSVNTNWTGSPAAGGPDAAGDIVTISPAGTNAVTVYNADGGDAVKTVGSLTFSGGTMTLSAGTGSGSLDFNNSGSNSVLKQTAGSVTISAPIATHSSSPLDITNQNGLGTTNRFFINGTISGDGALSITGPGGVVLGSAGNSFTGGVTLNSGTLTAGGGSGSYLGTGTLTINGGTLSAGGSSAGVWTSNNVQAWNGDFSTSGAFTLTTGTGAVTMSANRAIALSATTTGNFVVGGVISDGGNGYSLSLSGASRMTLTGANTYTGATTIGSGVTLILGNAGTTGSLSTGSAITDNGTFSLNRTNTITQGTDFAPVISGAGGVTQAGTGTAVLNGANTFTGAVAITAGTLSVASLNKVTGGTSSSNLGAPASTAAGTIAMGATTVSGTLVYTGTGETTDRVLNLAGTTGGAVVDQSGTGLLKFTSALTATGAGSKTLTLQGSTAGTGEVGGAIVDNGGSNVTRVSKAGTGTWTLSGANTYTGTTTISGGTLSVSSLNSVAGGVASSSLGAPVTGPNGTIAIGATTVAGGLTYTGGGETTDRVINLAGTTGGATISQSGTGLLKFTSSFTATGAGIKTLFLQGSSAGKGEILGVIVDNSGTNKTSVSKSGTGTWVLSGANSYTGATTISGGTLLAKNSTGSGTGTGAVSVNGGFFGGTGTVSGAITVNSGGAITPGDGGAGTFHAGSSLTWNSNNSLAGMTFDLGVNQAASDQLAITGAFTKGTGSTFVFNFVDAGYTPSIAYTVVTFGSTTFGAGDFAATGIAGNFAIVGNELQFTAVAIPEPSTCALLGGALALGAVFGVRRRRA